MQSLTRTWIKLFPNPGYYGWMIVGLGFLSSALTSPGQSFVISLFLDPVMDELGLSRVEISSIYAVALWLPPYACRSWGAGRIASRAADSSAGCWG